MRDTEIRALDLIDIDNLLHVGLNNKIIFNKLTRIFQVGSHLHKIREEFLIQLHVKVPTTINYNFRSLIDNSLETQSYNNLVQDLSLKKIQRKRNKQKE